MFARYLKSLAVAAAVVGLIPVAPAEAVHDPGFRAWVAELRVEALAEGVSAETFDIAFSGVEPLSNIIDQDRRQPEFARTFWSYVERRVSPERIARGREMLSRYGTMLRRIEREYGIQPRFLVAFWGLETNFGSYVGDVPVIAALATLAYDRRRSAFFRSHLIDALKILDEGHIAPNQMKGSWAGAMGQLQFMPETFRRYAVDDDGDGRRDIWTSLPDAFASAANFLHSLGWDGTKTWGREVRVPGDFKWEEASMSVVKPLSEWISLGVRNADGGNLSETDITASLILPAGHRGPAFLIYQNFRVIMRWNKSVNYALSVGLLSDLIIGNPPLVAARPPNERALSRAEIMEMQDLLNGVGLNTGPPDGFVGRQTRAALREYQRRIGHPADGHATIEIIDILRRE